MQLLFNFALQVEERAERSKKAHATNGSNKLIYLMRRPSGELATLYDVFGDLSKVVLSSGVLDLDDTELLPEQLTPRDSQHASVYPPNVSENVGM